MRSILTAYFDIRTGGCRQNGGGKGGVGRDRSNGTPFSKNAKFIETDATIMPDDERSIAHPLIGLDHPIYQGAGAYGVAGVPQVKEGAGVKGSRRSFVYRRNRRIRLARLTSC